MSKWIDFTIDERKAMIQAVSEEKQIDEASAEKDWWVTAVLYAIFHTSIGSISCSKVAQALARDGISSIVSVRTLTSHFQEISS